MRKFVPTEKGMEDTDVQVEKIRSVKSILYRVTINLLETIYGERSQEMKSLMPIHHRLLTSPSSRSKDNRDNDLIVYVEDELINKKKKKTYVVKDVLGKGAFGQVFLVRKKGDPSNKEYAAKVVKAVSNLAHYTINSEVKTLIALNKFEKLIQKGDKKIDSLRDKVSSKIVKLKDWFLLDEDENKVDSHVVIIFEKLEMSLLNILQIINYKGLTLNMIQKFALYTVQALQILKERNITHCDLKPENIMLEKHFLKLIDLGNACYNDQYPSFYMQTRYYRAPEVILAGDISKAIDMWSLGCILLELYIGIPVFPGNSNYDMLAKITSIVGPIPTLMLKSSPLANTYFTEDMESQEYRLLSKIEYQKKNNIVIPEKEQYHTFSSLSDIQHWYNKSEVRKNVAVFDLHLVPNFHSLITRMLELRPEARITPEEALAHDFLKIEEEG